MFVYQRVSSLILHLASEVYRQNRVALNLPGMQRLGVVAFRHPRREDLPRAPHGVKCWLDQVQNELSIITHTLKWRLLVNEPPKPEQSNQKYLAVDAIIKTITATPLKKHRILANIQLSSWISGPSFYSRSPWFLTSAPSAYWRSQLQRDHPAPVTKARKSASGHGRYSQWT